MSLLMQALKKAEQTKQKQQSDAVLSLSPTENHPETVFPAAETPSLEPVKSELVLADDASLSLTLDQTKPESHFLEDVLPATTISQPLNALAAQYEPFMGEGFTAPSSASYAVQETAHETAHNSAQKTPEADAILEMPATKPEQSMADRLQRPRIDPEQVRANAKVDPLLAAEQKKAQSVFASKTIPADRKKPWLFAFSGISLFVLAGVAYVYWQSNLIENRPGILGSAVNTVPAQIPEQLPTPASTANTNDIATASAASAVETSTLPTAIATNSSASTASNSAQNPASNANKASSSELKIAAVSKKNKEDDLGSAAGSSNQSSKKSAKPSSSNATSLPGHIVHDANAIQIRKGNSGNQINPTLSSAYQAFLAGDVATAERQYQSVLTQEPNSRDALLGLAALALNQRAADKAGGFYGKLLELDPNDPEAIAGLTSLQQGDPVQSESRLKIALTLHPNAGSILFALGNLYAQQGRWSDAQQNYFRAFTTQPVNADYAFNLAVSLDRLNQSKLAKEYYQRALEAGQNGPGNFSRSKVQQRIADLEKALNE
ncbi:tetratricopeptide repeat protein [Undibacterium sp. Di24W]|uniref:tetratricopeptide repeat protein n=1 Tax=Undibacterium sp. Di24W TaxID=3413033 RepID=UPI003BF1349B